MDMKRILSFDIGTRHLAYCALECSTEKTVNITHWNVVDLMSVQGTPYDEQCVWVLSKSWKMSQLKQYMMSKGLCTIGKKKELLSVVHKDLKKRKIPKASSTNLCILAAKLYCYLDQHPWMHTCDIIVLENQPCLTNPVMKSVQMILYGYFLYNSVWKVHQKNKEIVLPRVMLTSATNKLKVCTQSLQTAPASEEIMVHDVVNISTKINTNTTKVNTNTGKIKGKIKDNTKESKKKNYKERKKEAIHLTQSLLTQWKMLTNTEEQKQIWSKWLCLLTDSCVKEQDDLSDSFLQGLYVMHKNL